MAEPTNETGLVNAIVRAIKKRWPTAWIMKVHGSPLQHSGVPDLLILVEGRLVAAEVKHQKPRESEAHARGRATPGQRVQIAKIAAAGGTSGVVLTPGETIALIESALTKETER